MKIYGEKNLSDFEFWSGAKHRANVLTSEQMDEIESNLEELYPEGIADTILNDLFWFDEDTIAEWLGFDSFIALERFNNGEEESEG